MFCDIQTLLGRAVRRRPPLRAEAQPRAGPGEGLHVLRRPRDGVLLLPHRASGSSRSTTPATSTSPRTTSARSCASRRCCGSKRWASRSSTRSTRTGRASTRSTCATPTRSTMADNVMTFRLITKEVAHDHGVYATFMPKPIAGAFGSGMHTHLSLFEGDVNAFHDPGDEYGLSKVAKHFIAGLLVHASEIVAITNQWVNSYKRLIPGYEAPVYKCWARNNRSALVRVPLPKRGKNESTPHRVPRARPRVQPVPRVLGDARGRPEGHRRGLRPPARGDRQHLRAHRRRTAGRGHQRRCRDRCATRSTRWSIPS